MDVKARSPRTGRFIQIPREVLARTDIGLPAKVVYGVILDAMRDKQQAWPGLRGMAAAIGSSVTTVRKAIAQLKAVGLLLILPRTHGQGTLYRLPDGVHPVSTVDESASVHPCAQGVHPVSTQARPQVAPKRQTNEKTKPNKVRTEKVPDSWEAVEALLPGDSPLKTHRFREAWEAWAVYRREIHKKLTESTVRAQIKKCAKWAGKYGLDKVIGAIERAIEKGWTGFFEPDKESKCATDPSRVRAKAGAVSKYEVHRP